MFESSAFYGKSNAWRNPRDFYCETSVCIISIHCHSRWHSPIFNNKWNKKVKSHQTYWPSPPCVCLHMSNDTQWQVDYLLMACKLTVSQAWFCWMQIHWNFSMSQGPLKNYCKDTKEPNLSGYVQTISGPDALCRLIFLIILSYKTTVVYFDISFLVHALNQLFLPNESSISQASYRTMVLTICLQLIKKHTILWR